MVAVCLACVETHKFVPLTPDEQHQLFRVFGRERRLEQLEKLAAKNRKLRAYYRLKLSDNKLSGITAEPGDSQICVSKDSLDDDKTTVDESSGNYPNDEVVNQILAKTAATSLEQRKQLLQRRSEDDDDDVCEADTTAVE